MLAELKKTTKSKERFFDIGEEQKFLGKVEKKNKESITMKLGAQVQKRMSKYSTNERSQGIKETIDDRIIFTRILGHIEIRDSHIWKLDHKCWVCDKWHYTVIIVNKNVLEKCIIQNVDFNKDYYKKIIKESDKKANRELFVITSKPKVAGTFSNWQTKEMMPVNEFCDYILRNGLPSTRYYIQPDGSMYSAFAQALNQDIHKIVKRQF